MSEEIYHKQQSEKKIPRGKTLFFIIMSCWLLFFIYIGFQGGG